MIDELERRVRTLEEELNGERHVSRYMVEQAGRNSEVLHAVRSEVGAVRLDVNGLTVRMDILAGDMASVKATLVMHGRALDVVQQDVRQLRGDVTELQRDMEELRSHMDARLNAVDARFDAVDARFDAVLEAIRAIAPRQPPAGGE
jgi:phage shock protein A